MRFWGYIPYIDTNLPANQESPLNLHCTMRLQIIEEPAEKRKVAYRAFLDFEGFFDSTSIDIITKALIQ